MSLTVSKQKQRQEWAREIRAMYEEIQYGMELHVRRAVALGAKLREVKAKLPHGEFTAFLKSTFENSKGVRTIQRYMKAADYAEQYPELLEMATIVDDLLPKSEESKTTKMSFLENGQGDAEQSERKAGVVVIEADRSAESTKYNPAVEPSATRSKAEIRAAKRAAEEQEQRAADKAAGKCEPAIAVAAELVEKVPEPAGVLEQYFRNHTIREAIELLVLREVEAEKKKTAATLRRLAEKLDPSKKFVPPTLAEVAAYCEERGNGIDAEAFLAHYEMNGWKTSSGNRVASWEGCVITFEKFNKKYGTNGKTSSNAARTRNAKDIFG